MRVCLVQACIATTVLHAVSVATCLGAALIAATSAPDPSASPSALKLIVSRSCEWPEPVGLREVCGDVVEGRLLSRLADTAVTATPATRMWVAFVPRGCGPSGKARAQEEISRSPKKQVTKTIPTHPDVHTDRPTHSYTLRYTPGLPPAHRRQLSPCATKSKGPSGDPLTAHEAIGRHRQPERLRRLLRHGELHRNGDPLRHKRQPGPRRLVSWHSEHLTAPSCSQNFI